MAWRTGAQAFSPSTAPDSAPTGLHLRALPHPMLTLTGGLLIEQNQTVGLKSPRRHTGGISRPAQPLLGGPASPWEIRPPEVAPGHAWVHRIHPGWCPQQQPPSAQTRGPHSGDKVLSAVSWWPPYTARASPGGTHPWILGAGQTLAKSTSTPQIAALEAVSSGALGLAGGSVTL